MDHQVIESQLAAVTSIVAPRPNADVYDTIEKLADDPNALLEFLEADCTRGDLPLSVRAQLAERGSLAGIRTRIQLQNCVMYAQVATCAILK